jgi:polar amino acid transport system substrate-binding protein
MLSRNMLCSLLAAVAFSFGCNAANAAEPLKTVEAGQLTYGTAATFAPFEYMKDGALVGFDIDLINAIAKQMNLKPDPSNTQFSGLIPALQGGRTDIINSAMYMTPARAAQVDFVPYLKLGDRVVVTAGNPAKITGRDDSICGKIIAVTLGGIEETYARNHAAPTILTLPTAQDSILSLRQGRADAIYNSTPGTVTLLEEVPGVYEAVGPEFEVTTHIGIAVNKGNKPMADAIGQALAKVVADGTYKQLIAKWKLPPSVSMFD